MLQTAAWTLIGVPVFLIAYTYLGYPALLTILSRLFQQSEPEDAAVPEWPMISITVPVYNEEHQIRATLESLLRLDYPEGKRQILVVSDASSDRTDDIVREYADKGVELLRLARRGGKGAAEAAAAALLRGEIVVNTDASIRISPRALKPLIAAMNDPSVGLASGRDISVARLSADPNVGEAGYVGYEMWIRRLETNLWGIVGASGCFYAIRAHLHRDPLPDSLSRDFASALIAREHGYRAVSVDEATCLVPRTTSLHREYRRKVRTITRGMETLLYKRHLLNPVQHGLFAWMLFSHKVCRWLAPWAAFPAVLGLGLLSATQTWAALALALLLGGCVLAGLGWLLVEERDALPRLLALPTFLAAGNLAAMQAAVCALRGDVNAVWEPTRREVISVEG